MVECCRGVLISAFEISLLLRTALKVDVPRASYLPSVNACLLLWDTVAGGRITTYALAPERSPPEKKNSAGQTRTPSTAPPGPGCTPKQIWPGASFSLPDFRRTKGAASACLRVAWGPWQGDVQHGPLEHCETNKRIRCWAAPGPLQN